MVVWMVVVVVAAVVAVAVGGGGGTSTLATSLGSRRTRDSSRRTSNTKAIKPGIMLM